MVESPDPNAPDATTQDVGRPPGFDMQRPEAPKRDVVDVTDAVNQLRETGKTVDVTEAMPAANQAEVKAAAVDVNEVGQAAGAQLDAATAARMQEARDTIEKTAKPADEIPGPGAA